MLKSMVITFIEEWKQFSMKYFGFSTIFSEV